FTQMGNGVWSFADYACFAFVGVARQTRCLPKVKINTEAQRRGMWVHEFTRIFTNLELSNRLIRVNSCPFVDSLLCASASLCSSMHQISDSSTFLLRSSR